MTVVTISIIGLAAVLLAVQLKGVRGEYSTYLAASAGFVIFFYGVSKLEIILDAMKTIQSYIEINHVYLTTLMKMIGITYIAEFSSGICKDAGLRSGWNPDEIFGKLSILAVSTPILLALLDTLQVFLT